MWRKYRWKRNNNMFILMEHAFQSVSPFGIKSSSTELLYNKHFARPHWGLKLDFTCSQNAHASAFRRVRAYSSMGLQLRYKHVVQTYPSKAYERLFSIERNEQLNYIAAIISRHNEDLNRGCESELNFQSYFPTRQIWMPIS